MRWCLMHSDNFFAVFPLWDRKMVRNQASWVFHLSSMRGVRPWYAFHVAKSCQKWRERPSQAGKRPLKVPLQAKRSFWCVPWFSAQDHSTGWGTWRTELCFYASTYIHSLFISSLPILLTTKIKLCVSWFLCLSSAGKWLPWDHQYLFTRCIHFLRDSTELKVFLPTPVTLIRQTHTIHSLSLTVNTVKTQSLGRLLVFVNFSLT